jgi:16S rRNA processing protein RimM
MLADVMRAHGVRGEVRLRPFQRDSDLLLDVGEVLARLPEASRASFSGEERRDRVLRVEGARRANDAILMKLEGIDDRDGADELRGAVLCVRRADFPPLEEGEFYACDVVGAKVVLHDGAEVGSVRELKTYPTVEVLVVDATDGGGPLEVPLVDAFIAGVDVERGMVTLRTLDGVERQ